MLSCVVSVRIGRDRVRCDGLADCRTVDSIRDDIVLSLSKATL